MKTPCITISACSLAVIRLLFIYVFITAPVFYIAIYWKYVLSEGNTTVLLIVKGKTHVNMVAKIKPNVQRF